MNATTETREGLVFAPCSRCSGKGHIRGFERVAGGTCFACAGAGGEWVEAKVLARRKAAAKRRAAARRKSEGERLRQLDADRREEGWNWTEIREQLCGLDSDADFMLVGIWEDHEDHPKFPGWQRADGSSVK
jgi:hypothetical protein